MVWQVNVSDTTEAFEQAWKAADSPAANLHDAATTVELVMQIAPAIATAVPTAGASLLEIPVFRAITS